MNAITRLLFATVVIAMFAQTPAVAVTITFRQGFAGYTQGQDNWLYKQQPNTNFGTNPGLGIGKLGLPDEQHALIGFYGIFGNGVGQIPFGTTITSATLGLLNTGVTVPANGEIHQMFIPWTDTVDTWNSLNGGLNNVPAGEFDPTPSYSGSFGSGPFPVTPIVQAWSNGVPNYGFALIPTASGEIVVGTNESGLNLHPILTINYVAIPEPATVTLAILAGWVIVGMRRR